MPKDDWEKTNQRSAIRRANGRDDDWRDRVRWVVFIGRVPGVYKTWAECWEQVEDIRGNRYKKYTDPLPAWDAYELFQKTGNIPNSLRKRLEKRHREKPKRKRRSTRSKGRKVK